MKANAKSAMRYLILIAAILICFFVAAPLIAQRSRQATLTQEEAEKIKALGTDPNGRIGYFIKILDGRAKDIKALTKRAPTPARDSLIDGKLQDFTALMDELDDNLDEYGGREADLRGSLKTLDDTVPVWTGLLRALPASPAYDVSRQDAIESLGDLTDEGKQMLDQQVAYFKAHPKEKGQQRAEPD